jgi:hypothetical protein
MDSLVSQDLSDVLHALKGVTEQQAEQQVTVEGVGHKAEVLVQQLRILNGPVDYTHTRLRGQIIAELEHGELWRTHPSGLPSLNELLEEAGMPKSEASDLLAWEKHIYPYLEREMGIKPYEVWNKLNKTKRRMLTPILRTMADPGHKPTADTQRVIEILKGESDNPVAALLETASEMPTQDVKKKFSGAPVAELEMNAVRNVTLIIDNETGEITDEKVWYKVMFVCEEAQLEFLCKRLSDRLSLISQPGEVITVTK